MRSVEFKVESGVLFYRCLIVVEEDNFIEVNSDGEDIFESGVVRIRGYSDWEAVTEI